MSGTSENQQKSIASQMDEALEKWRVLTGVELDSQRFSWGDLDVSSMNAMMRRARELEPDSRTAFMMMEAFLRAYLESRSFTAAEIMRDYAATTLFLSRAEELFSLTQSDAATAEIAGFRGLMRQALARYRADTPEILALLDDNDALPFLRRDALESMEKLTAYQFLRGQPGEGPAQIIEHVYQAWDVNELLPALRDMPVNGIAVVLLRNPAHTDRSFFCFAMRNGGNVTLFTDRTRPAYPGQEDVLAGRGPRGTGRRFAARAWSNHFPYQLLRPGQNEDGDVIFEDETSPVMHGQTLVPLMRIGELPANQALWLTMMLSLVADRFWKQGWQAPQLSYTGAMIRQKDMMITGADGAALPSLANDYRPIGIDRLTKDDVSTEAMDAQSERPRVGVNDWMIERYGHQVSDDLLNLWNKPVGMDLILPAQQLQHRPNHEQKIIGEMVRAATPAGGGAILTPTPREHSFDVRIPGSALSAFSDHDFGTEEDILRDQTYIARKNYAAAIGRAASDEFERRKGEVQQWWRERLQDNTDGILDLLAAQTAGVSMPQYEHAPQNAFSITRAGSNEDRYCRMAGSHLGNRDWRKSRGDCLITDSATVQSRIGYQPWLADDIARMAGCGIADLPDVLVHWRRQAPYTGNNLLLRLDPVDAQLVNPWYKLDLSFEFWLSKRGLAEIAKRAARIEKMKDDSHVA